jgi:hypothetical protein
MSIVEQLAVDRASGGKPCSTRAFQVDNGTRRRSNSTVFNEMQGEFRQMALPVHDVIEIRLGLRSRHQSANMVALRFGRVCFYSWLVEHRKRYVWLYAGAVFRCTGGFYDRKAFIDEKRSQNSVHVETRVNCTPDLNDERISYSVPWTENVFGILHALVSHQLTAEMGAQVLPMVMRAGKTMNQ